MNFVVSFNGFTETIRVCIVRPIIIARARHFSVVDHEHQRHGTILR